MTLNQLLLVLRARYRLILAAFLITVVAAVVVAQLLPPKYKATTTLVLEFKSVDPITGSFLPIQLLLSSYIATEIDILESRAVALKVVKAMHLAENEETRRRFVETGNSGRIEDWLAAGLLGKLEIKPSKESRLIDVNYTSPNPQFSADVANAFARAYIETNLDMKTTPAKDSAVWFNGQLKGLRDQLEAAQAHLSKYQSEKGITSSDQRLDMESTKLSELSSQLVQAQGQAYEFLTRQKQLEEFIAKGRTAESLPEVLASPVIQDLKSRLSVAESKLSQASGSFGVNHPEYQRAQSEVDSIQKKLNYEIRNASSVIGNNYRVAQGRERELQAAVATQKARLLGLNRGRDEVGVLTREVENAQRSYDAASQRQTQTSLESRMDQSNATVLVPAIAPDRPSFPNWRIVILLATAVGALLSFGIAVLAEMLDRRIRGVDDLVECANAQVWGVLSDTSALSRVVDRLGKKAIKRGRFIRTIKEPTLT